MGLYFLLFHLDLLLQAGVAALLLAHFVLGDLDLGIEQALVVDVLDFLYGQALHKPFCPCL